MIKSILTDGGGSGAQACVTESNSLKVQSLPQTARGLSAAEVANLRYLNTLLATSAGSSALNVNGAVTNATFFVEASTGVTRWITGLRFTLEGANLLVTSSDFRRFGNATAASTPLTNGILVRAIQAGVTVNIATTPITTLGDFLNYTNQYISLDNVVGTTDDYTQFVITFPTPIVLPTGSQDRIEIVIRDNLTAILLFNCAAFGYQESD